MNSRLIIWSRALTSMNKLPQRNPLTPTTGAPAPVVAAAPAPAPRTPQKDPQQRKPPAEVELLPQDHQSVYSTPEAWPRKFKESGTPKGVKVSQNPPGRPRMKPDQRRRNTISIAMSEEEESSIRHAAAEKGVSISEWARVAMFKHMGRSVPKRDDRRRDWAKTTGEAED